MEYQFEVGGESQTEETMLQLKPSDKGRGPTLEIFLDEAHNK
jgi:hypothetical protein